MIKKLRRFTIKRARRIKKLDVAVFFFLLAVILSNLAFYYSSGAKDLNRAEVVKVLSTKNDGGLIYQEMEVASEGTTYLITQEVTDNKELQYEVGDSVILQQKNVNIKIAGFDQSEILVLCLAGLLLLLVISIGIDDFKEILPVLLFLPFVMSGLLFEFIDQIGVVLVSALFFTIITFVTVIAISHKPRIAFANTIANFLTMIAILPLSLFLYKVFHIANSNENLYHFGVLVVIFGTIINSSIATTRKTVNALKRQVYSRELIRKIIVDSQKDIARRINSVFFILLGFSIVGMALSYQNRADFWNEGVLISNFVYFIILGLSVILSVFFSAILVTYFVRSAVQKN